MPITKHRWVWGGSAAALMIWGAWVFLSTPLGWDEAAAQKKRTVKVKAEAVSRDIQAGNRSVDELHKQEETPSAEVTHPSETSVDTDDHSHDEESISPAQSSIADQLKAQVERIDHGEEISAESESESDPNQSVGAIIAAAPSKGEYRREFAGDQHGSMTPSMRQFAVTVASRMEQALNDEVVANEVMDELETCALDKQEALPRSVRATCAENAVRLGKTHPSLIDRSKSLVRELPEGITMLLH